MKNMTLERITEVCGGVYYGSEADKKKEIAGAVIDSRQVESGYLFIAVKGEKVDGHQFIPQVFEKGALAVLSEQELSEPAGPYIRVESTLGAMKKLAAYYRRSLDIKVVGITGSVPRSTAATSSTNSSTRNRPGCQGNTHYKKRLRAFFCYGFSAVRQEKVAYHKNFIEKQ